MNLSLTNILSDGLVLSVGLTAVIIGSLRFNPRLWLQDYPPEMKALAAPLTATEKRQQTLVSMLFLAVVATVLYGSITRLHAINGGQPSLVTLFLHTYSVLMIANLFDLLVLDYFVLTLIRPRFAFIPGTEAALNTVNFIRFHFIGFLKGCVYMAVVSIVVSILVTVF